MLTFALLLLFCGVFLYVMQDRERAHALLSARTVGLADLGDVPDGTLVAVHGAVGGQALSGPLSHRRCVWWAATRVEAAAAFADRQRVEGWDMSRAAVRLGEAALVDPAALRTYDVLLASHGRAETVLEGHCAVEYVLDDGAPVTVVGRARHRPDGLTALLPPGAQRHVRLYPHAPRMARLRVLAREGAAWMCGVAALVLTLAA